MSKPGRQRSTGERSYYGARGQEGSGRGRTKLGMGSIYILMRRRPSATGVGVAGGIVRDLTVTYMRWMEAVRGLRMDIGIHIRSPAYGGESIDTYTAVFVFAA